MFISRVSFYIFYFCIFRIKTKFLYIFLKERWISLMGYLYLFFFENNVLYCLTELFTTNAPKLSVYLFTNFKNNETKISKPI